MFMVFLSGLDCLKNKTFTGGSLSVVFISCLLLSGCLSAPVKVSQTVKPHIKTVRVVALETPPLEVWPDLLDSRMPVYAHYDNMALPLSVERKLYRYHGEILIAGNVGENDSVNLAEKPNGWRFSDIVMQEGFAQLSAAQFQVSARREVLPLTITASARDAELSHWHDAIEAWYREDRVNVAQGNDKADAILQLGIRRYKVFSGQISLQLLIKLIDAQSGKVVARTDESSSAYEAPIPALFDNNGERFKSLLRRRTGELLAQGLRDIGLITR